MRPAAAMAEIAPSAFGSATPKIAFTCGSALRIDRTMVSLDEVACWVYCSVTTLTPG